MWNSRAISANWDIRSKHIVEFNACPRDVKSHHVESLGAINLLLSPNFNPRSYWTTTVVLPQRPAIKMFTGVFPRLHLNVQNPQSRNSQAHQCQFSHEELQTEMNLMRVRAAKDDMKSHLTESLSALQTVPSLRAVHSFLSPNFNSSSHSSSSCPATKRLLQEHFQNSI